MLMIDNGLTQRADFRSILRRNYLFAFVSVAIAFAIAKLLAAAGEWGYYRWIFGCSLAASQGGYLGLASALRRPRPSQPPISEDVPHDTPVQRQTGLRRHGRSRPEGVMSITGIWLHSSVGIASFLFALASLFINVLLYFLHGNAFHFTLDLGMLLCLTGGLFGVAGIIHGGLREKKIRLAVWGILLAMLSYLLYAVFGAAYIGP